MPKEEEKDPVRHRVEGSWGWKEDEDPFDLDAAGVAVVPSISGILFWSLPGGVLVFNDLDTAEAARGTLYHAEAELCIDAVSELIKEQQFAERARFIGLDGGIMFARPTTLQVCYEVTETNAKFEHITIPSLTPREF